METLKKNSSVLFATFSPYVNGKRDPKNGNIDPMISFFVPRVTCFILVDQPHTGGSVIPPVVEEYEEGILKRKYFLEPLFYKPFYWLLAHLKLTDDDTNIFFKIRDFISVLHVGLKTKKKINYLIGLESINALAGILLRKFGRVENVIYYVSDYSPTRYSNKVFNWLYVNLDRFCCYNANYIWDVSKAMHLARIKAGLNPKKSAPVIHVPNALFPEFIKHMPFEKLVPYSLVFMGSLGPENGPDLAILTLPDVIKRFPKARLYIIGGREKDLTRLKMLCKNLNLEKYVTFHGMIPQDKKMLQVLRKYYLALAPYLRQKNSVRWFGDSLKLRAYMGSGLPVITTEVPPLGRELESFGSALIVKDDKNDIAASIIKLFSDEKLYRKYRSRAIEYGRNNTWENTFNQAFRKMEEI